MRTAIAVKARPVRIALVPPGTSVGYAGTWTTTRESTIATLPIGYADGWARSSSPGTSALVEGTRAPVVGRISSDSLTVDVTGIEGVGSDSEFTLLGAVDNDEITAEEIAGVRGTISWEVLQQLGSRLTRVYLSGNAPVALRPEMSIELASVGSGPPGYQL
jgi:alanine racemase